MTEYPMAIECTDRYEALFTADGALLVTIKVPRRFAQLWLHRLSELTTTDAEIEHFAPESAEGPEPAL